MKVLERRFQTVGVVPLLPIRPPILQALILNFVPINALRTPDFRASQRSALPLPDLFTH
jgi:hypothetical protein